MDPTALVKVPSSSFLADPLSVKRDEADDAIEAILSTKKRKIEVESNSSASVSGSSTTAKSSSPTEVGQPACSLPSTSDCPSSSLQQS